MSISLLAITQTFSGLAPMLAQILGALLTLKDEDRYTETLIGSMGRLIIVSKNKSFFIPVIIFSLNALPFMIMSLTGSTIRPFSSNILFEQQKGDSGSASSLINTSFTVLGSIGMSIASMPWGNIVVGLGALITIFSIISLLSWSLFMKSSIPCMGVKDIDI